MRISSQPSPRIHIKLPKKQQGVVLIVCLIMLLILTTIAIGTSVDMGLQSNMARNHQISMETFNVTLTELKAQFEASKNDDDVASQSISYDQLLANVRQSETREVLTSGDSLVIDTGAHSFEKEVSIEYLGAVGCGGGELDGNLMYEISVVSNPANLTIKSDQTFLICYPRAQ